jgi:hypothetical protein
MKFRAKILLGGKTASGIRVPAKVIASLGSTKRLPVRVKLNGYNYRSTVASIGGQFMLPVSAEHRNGAGVAAGDTVDVDIEVDTDLRVVPVPPILPTLANEMRWPPGASNR